MNKFFWTIASCVFLATTGTVNAVPVECGDKVTTPLKELLAKKFPDYRIPKLADLDKDYVDYDAKNGGDGCFAVALGDFDGDRQQDLAVLLIDKVSNSPTLVVALKRPDTWAIFKLQAFCTMTPACYVKPIEPSTYKRSEALDGPVGRPDERQKITSKTTSIIVGKMESTGIVYVYLKDAWKYVWVSD